MIINPERALSNELIFLVISPSPSFLKRGILYNPHLLKGIKGDY
jgi:hypothetical protein